MELEELLAIQDRVAYRAQVLACGEGGARRTSTDAEAGVGEGDRGGLRRPHG